MVTDGLVIRPDDPNAAHVADLLAFHLGELRATVPPGYAFALDAGGLSAADISFWTAWRGDDLAGFVALKRLEEPGAAELKSMRAAPAARRSDVGRALLDHAIASARTAGFRRLHLETGTAPSYTPAVALYRSAGFVDCPPFADYQPSAHNRFMTLPL